MSLDVLSKQGKIVHRYRLAHFFRLKFESTYHLSAHLMLLKNSVLLELLEPESEVLGVGHLDVVQVALLVVDVDAAYLRLGQGAIHIWRPSFAGGGVSNYLGFVIFLSIHG